MIIDDRTGPGLTSNLGTQWKAVTDQVMGGKSKASISETNKLGRKCLQLSARVSTENNGGFAQLSLPLAIDRALDASDFNRLELEILGNNEQYNLHLKTTDLWLPWQSYRAGFNATDTWQTVTIPFRDLKPYRTSKSFKPDRLVRLGLVAIGREFDAELCVASIRFKGE